MMRIFVYVCYVCHLCARGVSVSDAMLINFASKAPMLLGFTSGGQMGFGQF